MARPFFKITVDVQRLWREWREVAFSPCFLYIHIYTLYIWYILFTTLRNIKRATICHYLNKPLMAKGFKDGVTKKVVPTLRHLKASDATVIPLDGETGNASFSASTLDQLSP